MGTVIRTHSAALWWLARYRMSHFTYFPVGLYMYILWSQSKYRRSKCESVLGKPNSMHGSFSKISPGSHPEDARQRLLSLLTSSRSLSGSVEGSGCAVGKKVNKKNFLWGSAVTDVALKLWVRHTHSASLSLYSSLGYRVSTLAIIMLGENSRADTPDNRRAINKARHSVG